MIDLYIARQPIFDKSLKLHGYELLYRDAESETAQFTDDNQATSHVITTGLIDIGLDNLVGSHKAFINLSRDFAVGTHELPYPPDKVVIELSDRNLEAQDIDTILQYLGKQKFQVALDGIHPDSDLLKLLPVANLVKVDLSLTPTEQLPTLVQQIRQRKVALVAEKVEDGQLVDQLLQMGFDYLQGYFFSRPIIMKQSSLSPNQTAMMNLLNKVYNTETSTEDLEATICRDVTLSYHLLRYINSAFFNLTQTVESIRQAVIYLGRNTLKTWATVISMAGHNSKPDELINLALTRARLCESLSNIVEPDEADSFFSAGLLSVLDALMDHPMEDIVARLPLSKTLVDALLEREGKIGKALSCCEALEQGDWEKVKFFDISSAALNMQYRTAIQWADDAISNMSL